MPKLFTPEEKIKIVLDFKASNKNALQFSQRLAISSVTLLNWARAYDEHGIEAFKRTKSSILEENAQLRRELKTTKRELEENKIQKEMFKLLEEMIERKKVKWQLNINKCLVVTQTHLKFPHLELQISSL